MLVEYIKLVKHLCFANIFIWKKFLLLRIAMFLLHMNKIHYMCDYVFETTDGLRNKALEHYVF